MQAFDAGQLPFHLQNRRLGHRQRRWDDKDFSGVFRLHPGNEALEQFVLFGFQLGEQFRGILRLICGWLATHEWPEPDPGVRQVELHVRVILQAVIDPTAVVFRLILIVRPPQHRIPTGISDCRQQDWLGLFVEAEDPVFLLPLVADASRHTAARMGVKRLGETGRLTNGG